MPTPSKTTIGLRKRLVDAVQKGENLSDMLKDFSFSEVGSLCMWSLKAGHYAVLSQLVDLCDEKSLINVRRRAGSLITEQSPSSRKFWFYLRDHPRLRLHLGCCGGFDGKITHDIFLDVPDKDYTNSLLEYASDVIKSPGKEKEYLCQSFVVHFLSMTNGRVKRIERALHVFPSLPETVKNLIRNIPIQDLLSPQKENLHQALRFKILSKFGFKNFDSVVEPIWENLLQQAKKAPPIHVAVPLGDLAEAIAEYTALPEGNVREMVNLLRVSMGNGVERYPNLMAQDTRDELMLVSKNQPTQIRPRKKI